MSGRSGNKTPKATSILVVGWLLLSALIFVSAAFDLLNLLDPEQMVESHEISSARRKFREVEELFTAILEAKNGGGDLDEVLLAQSPPRPSVGEKGFSVGEEGFSVAEPEPVFLPKLSGIVTVMSETGETRYRAVIDSATVGEGQRVGTFEVLRIAPDHVVVGRDGRRWMLQRPKVPYSINQE